MYAHASAGSAHANTHALALAFFFLRSFVSQVPYHLACDRQTARMHAVRDGHTLQEPSSSKRHVADTTPLSSTLPPVTSENVDYLGVVISDMPFTTTRVDL